MLTKVSNLFSALIELLVFAAWLSCHSAYAEMIPLKLQDKYDTVGWMNCQHLYTVIPGWGYTNAESWTSSTYLPTDYEYSIHSNAVAGTLDNKLFTRDVLSYGAAPIYGPPGEDVHGHSIYATNSVPPEVRDEYGDPRLTTICRSYRGLNKDAINADGTTVDSALGFPLTGLSWYQMGELPGDNYAPLGEFSDFIREVWPNCTNLVPQKTYHPTVVDYPTDWGESSNYILENPYDMAMYYSVSIGHPLYPLPLYGFFVPYGLIRKTELSDCHHVFRYGGASIIDIARRKDYYGIYQDVTWNLTFGPVHISSSYPVITTGGTIDTGRMVVYTNRSESVTNVPFFKRVEFESYADCSGAPFHEVNIPVYKYIIENGAIRDMREWEGSLMDRSKYRVRDCYVWDFPSREVLVSELGKLSWSSSFTFNENIVYETLMSYPEITKSQTKKEWEFQSLFPPTRNPNIYDDGFAIVDRRAVSIYNTRELYGNPPYPYQGRGGEEEDIPAEYTGKHVEVPWSSGVSDFVGNSCASAISECGRLIDLHKLGPYMYDSLPRHFDGNIEEGEDICGYCCLVYDKNNDDALVGVCYNLQPSVGDIAIEEYRQSESNGYIRAQSEGYRKELLYGEIVDGNNRIMDLSRWELTSWIAISPFFSYKIEPPWFKPRIGKTER